MMDRNLGATVTKLESNWSAPTMTNVYDVAPYSGMFYQFGRKDPFVGGSTSSTAASPVDMTFYKANGDAAEILTPEASGSATVLTDGNLINAINNPLSYYTYSGDWAFPGTSVTNYYWGTATGAKSPFDPSPAGWRLPVVESSNVGTWSDFSTNTFETGSYKGREYDSRVFYPASGYRDNASGAMTNVGSGGYYWSATSGSISGGYSLNFSSSLVYPANSSNRSSGRPVRPIQE